MNLGEDLFKEDQDNIFAQDFSRLTHAEVDFVREQLAQAQRFADRVFTEEQEVAIKDFIKSLTFEALIGAVILIHILVMGLESDLCAGGPDGPRYSKDCPVMFVTVIGQLCVAFFVVEFFLRYYAYGINDLRKPEHFIDAVLVWIPGVGAKWVLEPLGVDIHSVDYFQILRVFRLVKIIRDVRVVKLFRPAWTLIRGIMESGMDMLWTVFGVSVIFFAFTILGLDLIDDYFPAYVERGIDNHVNGFGDFMLTLVQLWTLDSWSGLLREMMLIHKENWVAVVIFVFTFIFLGVYVVLNLVTAMVIDLTMMIQEEYRNEDMRLMETRIKEKREKMQDMFERIDKDKSGIIDLEEIKEAIDNDPHIAEILAVIGITRDRMEDLFHLMDNGDGNLEWHEFAHGMELLLEDKLESKRLIYVMKRIEQFEALFVSAFHEYMTQGKLHDGSRAIAFSNAVKSTLPVWFEDSEWIQEQVSAPKTQEQKKPKKGEERPSDKDYTRPEDETARNAVFRLATHLATVEKKVDTLIEGLVEVKLFQPKLIEINEAMRGLSGDVDVVIDYMRNEYGLPIDPEAELNEYGDDDDED